MIILIALFSWWFSCLSSLPQHLMIWFKDRTITNKIIQFVIINILRLISCEKCLGFWIGGIYSYSIYSNLLGSILLGGICSLTAKISARIYYKLLS